MVNRVHTHTRWPSDVYERLLMARLDMHFVLALEKCGCEPCREFRDIRLIAAQQYDLASRELGWI